MTTGDWTCTQHTTAQCWAPLAGYPKKRELSDEDIDRIARRVVELLEKKP